METQTWKGKGRPPGASARWDGTVAFTAATLSPGFPGRAPQIPQETFSAATTCLHHCPREQGVPGVTADFARPRARIAEILQTGFGPGDVWPLLGTGEGGAGCRHAAWLPLGPVRACQGLSSRSWEPAFRRRLPVILETRASWLVCAPLCDDPAQRAPRGRLVLR